MEQFVDIQEVRLKNIEDWIRKEYLKGKHECDLITDLIIDYLSSERFPDPKSLGCELADYGFLSPIEVKKLVSQLWLQLKREQSIYQERTTTTHNAKYLKTSNHSGSSRVGSKIGSDSKDTLDRPRHSTKVFTDDDDWTISNFSGSTTKRVYSEK